MKRFAFAVALGLLAVGLLALHPERTHAAAAVGQAAPDFSLTDVKGAKHVLSSYKGKFVVLEWINYDCPFVQKHYASGNMQKLQKAYAAKGVAWLTINSSAPGKQGHFANAEIETRSKAHGAAFAAYLLDTDGQVGRAYGAKTTPHMYVIDPAGKLVYAGGIDDKPSTDVADIAAAKNYVQAALDEALAGKAVTVTTSTPYGCSVKY
jgi:peroxiredoxin